jgi:WD40 repeat protein
VSPAVAAIVRKLMAKKADDRYQTPAEVVAALDALWPRGSGAAVGGPAISPPGGVPATVPMAVPVSGPVPKGIPIAQPVGPSLARPAVSPWARLQQALRDRKNWPLIAAAVVTLLLGLIFLIVALSSGGPRRSSGPPPPSDPLALMLRALMDRPTKTAAQREALRRDLIHFRALNPGTPQAYGVAKHLTRMPSPLDPLKREAPGAEGLPAEVVAVVGEQRQRHWGGVRAVAFAAGGKLIASGGDDRVIRLWNPANMQEAGILAGHTAPIGWLAFSPGNQFLASLGLDGSLRLWDSLLTKQPRLRQEPIVLAKSVRIAAFSSDGLVLAFAADDRGVAVLDLAGLKPGMKPRVKATVTTPVGAALAYHTKTQTLAVAGVEQGITLWDVGPTPPRQRAALVGGHDGPVLALAFSDNGQLLFSGGYDSTIRAWTNAHTAKPGAGRQFRGHTAEVLAISLSANGQSLVSTSADLTARCWDLSGKRGFESLPLTAGPSHWINAVALTGNGQQLVSGGQDATVRLWDVAGNQVRERFPLQLPVGMTTAVAFSPTGQMLAVSNDSDPIIRVWDLTRNQVGQIPGENGWGYSLAFAPDGLILASCGAFANLVQLWDLDAWDRRGPDTLPPQVQRVLALAFSPDGKLLATTSMDRMVQLWNVVGPRPREVRRLVGHRQPVLALAFSPDGKTLASAAGDETVRLWNVETGRQEHLLTGVHGRALAFSPDGALLASGGCDAAEVGQIRLWDLSSTSLREKAVVFKRAHSRPVSALHFLPDGEGLVSAGEDGQVIVHAPTTGNPLNSWRLGGPIRGAALAVDGRHLATANGNGTVYILRIRPVPGQT